MVYIEDISEEHGDDGVSVYSVIENMEFYYAEVRASGVTILTDLDKGTEMSDDDPIKKELINAVEQHIIKELK
jgi:hypothetical protein